MRIILFFIFISASVHAMDQLQQNSSVTQDTFTSLPDPLKKEILGYLISKADDGSAQGFFSLARTCRANNELCRNFCALEGNQKVVEQLEKLRINSFLNATITDSNVAQIIGIAHLNDDMQKEDECTRYMDSRIEPNCRDVFKDTCRRCFIFNFDRDEIIKRDFHRIIRKKYGIQYTIKMPENSQYENKRLLYGDCVCCLCVCCRDSVKCCKESCLCCVECCAADCDNADSCN